MNTTRLVILTVLLSGTILASKGLCQEEANDRHLELGQTALRSREYKLAIATFEKAIAQKGKRLDEAVYLKALAQFYAKEYNGCIASCDQLAERHPQSAWLHKSRFLKANAHVQERDYKNAEAIYEAEASRLLSSVRKQDVARVIIHFADALGTVPDKDDLKAPPADFNKAYSLYNKALALEIGRNLRDEVMFKRARAIQQAKNAGVAINDFRTYLQEFDPDWIGNVGSPQRASGMKKENPNPAGSHILAARFHLAEAQLLAGQMIPARVNLEDLLRLIEQKEKAADHAKLIADAHWLIVQAYRLPQPQALELERGIKAAREFASAHADDPRAVYAAWYIAAAYHHHGRADAAIEAYQDFVTKTHHRLPQGDAATDPIPGMAGTPAGLQSDWEKAALYHIAQIRYGQKKYKLATAAWQSYINKYPDGPQWADCQRGVINAQFQVAMDAVEAKDYPQAQKLFKDFLAANPLDNRARMILFLFGQLAYQDAIDLEAKKDDPSLADQEKPNEESIHAAFQIAIDQWQRLVNKYPNTEESSVALYRIGLIQEDKLGDWQAALHSYQRLKWGSKAGSARTRENLMIKPALALQTKRTYRTDESPIVKLSTRNIKKVTVKQYFLDLEAYFRKTHAVGSIDHLDIGLIEPDKSWEVELEDYDDYRPILQDIEVPFKDDQPGVCLINVSDDNFEATTLVIRSDLELIFKTSRREALVFVQNQRLGQPAANVKILLSDGKRVFTTGNTADDGVFRKTLDELKTIENLRVFAVAGNHVASNIVSLNGLQFSTGLAAKGYLYTDRPAYQPGDTVKLRGIIRDVDDGTYMVPNKKTYLVSVIDASGRLIWEVEQELGKYGTFHSQLRLDARAPLGSYTLTAREKEKPQQAYSSTFTVQRFQLEKIRLKLDTDRPVYFRGEMVELEIHAEFYWGQPVADKSISYHLPDGRHLIGTTDASGKLLVKYDTTGSQSGAMLRFTVSIDGENVQGFHEVFLAREGFKTTVKPNQSLVLSGEPFDVTVTSHTPDGKPIEKELTLHVLQRQITQPNPVLRAIPWLNSQAAQRTQESTVQQHKVTTDPESGEGTIRMTLEQGGKYILRVTAEDRFEQTISAETHVEISDDSDATKLRFFSESDTLQVGADAKLRLHSRLNGNLALLTFEGEEIIAHQVITLKKGYNSIELKVDHEHFPNFTVCVTALDDRSLRVAQKSFQVERQLKVVVQPKKKIDRPNAEAEIEIIVTDQLGHPVQAEFSLALVDEALFSLFGDASVNIREFFQKDAQRHAAFRAGSSAGFAYSAATRKVLQELLDEKQRLERSQVEQELLTEAAKSLETRQLAMFRQRGLNELKKEMDKGAVVEAPRQPMGRGGRAMPAAKPQSESEANFAYSKSKRELLGLADSSGNAAAVKDGLPASDLFFGRQVKKDLSGFLGGEDADGDSVDAAIRRELVGAGQWLPIIVTNKEGKATVEFTLPGTTSEWRLTARGVTIQTLVGQATGTVITRKDFFVNIKTPAQLQEGDSLQVLARVHNLTDFEGDAKVTLKLLGGEGFKQTLSERSAIAKVTKQGVAELMLAAIKIPLVANLRLQVTAESVDAKLTDTISRTYPVRPWGLEFADHHGGVARGDATAKVSLPADRRDGSQWMSITVGPSLKQSVIDMALGSAITPWAKSGRNRQYWIAPPHRVGGFIGSDLLAATKALQFAQKTSAEPDSLTRLGNRTRTLVGALVVSQQKDGGWIWNSEGASSHFGVTATSFWALCAARDIGIPVHTDTIKKAEEFLKTQFTKLNTNDNDGKAVVLHALSVNKSADFAHANRLHRQRNTLSAPALAYTALAFHNLDRDEFADELLTVLAKKLATTTVGNRQLKNAPGVRNNSWTSEEIETTALAALAFMRSKPASPQIPQMIDYLLDRRGAYGFAVAKARGAAVAAVAEFYSKGKFAQDDYELTILVNGQELETLKVQGTKQSISFAVPTELLQADENSVDFRLNGRGEYAYAVSLRGFSKNLKDPKSWEYPYVVSQRYYHVPLEYRGKSIGVTSSTQVKNVEIGQRVRVSVDIRYYSNRDDRGYKVIQEYIPAGMMFVEGSLVGPHKHFELDGNKLTLYFPTGTSANDYSYQLIGYASGEYRALPTVIRDAVNTSRVRIGIPSTLRVLAPGDKSEDPYVMNDSERFKLGQLNFNDGRYDQALEYLAELHTKNPRFNEQHVCRMLLWIYTSKDRYDAQQIIDVFEVLRERYPTLEIPFEKILTVGRAYRDLSEFERAYLVFRATIDASFINDVNISAVLEDEGQFLGSIDYQEDLWREYPDASEVSSMYFSISQALYLNAARAHELAKQERNIAIMRGGKPVRQDVRKPEKIAMLRETIRLLVSFMTLNPENPLSDDAAFSMANALLDLKQFDLVISSCERFKQHFTDSEFASGYQYMTALGQFWKHNYAEALQAAATVAEGDSKDKEFAEYMIGQIHHAEGNPALAIQWYTKVKEKYPDARQAIDYFEEKHITLEEVNVVRPGDKVDLEIKYRNIKEAYMQVYRVDLMKLYLREKNLSKITQISLAGIAPLLESTVQLGDGKDYINKAKIATLDLEKDGAYLVICRGDNLFASGLVLITPLKIEVQEDATSGRVRANVRDVAADKYVAGVHVKAIGSDDSVFKNGETDLRGIFIADDLHGTATVIARDDQSRYAFYRGTTRIGAPKPTPEAAAEPKMQLPKPAALNYQRNLQIQNGMIQDSNWRGYDAFRRGQTKGVQIQQVK